MAMGRSSFSPQPTKGIHSNSRFSTQTCGGNITNCATVSHAEVWLLITMWLPAGMRSRPSTVYLSPHRAPSIQNKMRAQVRAIANCAEYGSQKHSAMNPPNRQADAIM